MNARSAQSGADRVAPLALAFLFVVVLIIHRPWEFAPFSRTDFSEFLPLLTGNGDFASRFSAFLERYAVEGRFNVLQYASLAFKWSVLGDAPVLWQLVRTAQMAILVAGVYVLLRRLALTPTGAAAGASLFVVGGAATSAFTRLTMGEPLGTIFLIGAGILAAGYSSQERWLASALAICGLIAGALLTKELLVGAIPFVLILASCRDAEQRWIAPRFRERKTWVLLCMVAATVLAVMIPVAWIALHSREGSFSSAYGGEGFRQFGNAFAALLFPWVPWEAVSGFGTAGLVPNFVFLACVASIIMLSRDSRRTKLATLSVGLLLPLAFAVLYAPWSYVLPFYSLPTTIGSALLVGYAIDQLRTHQGRLIPVGAAAGVLSVVVSLKLVTVFADHARADRHLDQELVERLSAETTATEIIVSAFRPTEGAQAWTGRGPTIVRYASVLSGRPMAPAREVNCRTLEELYRAPPRSPVLLIVFPEDCGASPAPTTRVIHRFRSFRFWPPEIVTDSIGADLVRLPVARDGRPFEDLNRN